MLKTIRISKNSGLHSLLRLTRSVLAVFAVLSGLTGLAFAADDSTQRPAATDSDWDQKSQQYWADAKADVFQGIELTPSQEKAVDALIDEAAAGRARHNALWRVFEQARKEGATERADALSQELAEIRATFRPIPRILKMGELLNDDQRKIFDRNVRLRDDRMVGARLERERATRMQAQKPEAMSAEVPAE